MYKLYSMQLSANSYKVRLMLSWTGQPFKLVDVDVIAGESRTPEFLQRNPTGQVPLLVLPDGRHLPESGAILYFLAHGTPLLPDEPYARANVLRWMFFEQHSHDPFIGQARFWSRLVRNGRVLKQNLLEEWEDRGYDALRVMDAHLRKAPFFGNEQPCLADIALFANTHLAHEGGFDLEPFEGIRDWIGRMSVQERFVPIDWRPPVFMTAGALPPAPRTEPAA